jgi:hypothetical protein
MVIDINSLNSISQQLELFFQQNPWIFPALIAIQIWKLAWYGFAIYIAAFKRQEKTWFFVLLVCAFFLNDLGILAILYIIYQKYASNLHKRKVVVISRRKK